MECIGQLYVHCITRVPLASFMEGNITVAYNGSNHDYVMAARVLYGIEACFSLMANLLVVFLFTCRRHLLSNPHNRCILSLAITDILTSTFVLFNPNLVIDEKFFKTESMNSIARELFCHIMWNNFLPFFLGVASLYTSVLLSFERWLAVRRSIFYKSRFRIRHMNMLILVAWVAAFAAEFPVTVFAESVYDDPVRSCRWSFPESKLSAITLSITLFVLQTVLPFVMITLAYIDVFRGIRASLRFVASARAENVNAIKRLKKVTKVAAITTLILAFSWLPCSISFFLSLLNYDPFHAHEPFVVALGLLTFSNTCINPCIYVFSNPELKNAFREIFR